MGKGTPQNTTNNFFKGMNKDGSKALLSNDQYRDAHNLRITDITGEGNGALVNVRGNDLSITLPTVNSVIKFKNSSTTTGAGSTRYLCFQMMNDPNDITAGASSDFYYFEIEPNELPAGVTIGAFYDTVVTLLKVKQGYFHNGTPTPTTGTLWDEGFRIYPSDGGTSIECTNINKNKQIYYGRFQSSNASFGASAITPAGYRDLEPNQEVRIIGSTSLRDSLILFTTCLESEFGQVWQIDINRETLQASTPSLKYNRRVGFDINYPIEAVARYESTTVQRVYWTDNFNEVRSLNLAKVDPGETDPSLLDLNPAVNIGQLRVNDIGTGGTLQVGLHQYGYRLTSNDGVLTKFSTLTPLIPIVQGSESGNTFYTTDENNEFTGKNLGAISDKSVTLYVTDLDLDYDVIEIVHLYYAQRGVDPIVNIVESQNILSTGNAEFTHTGAETAIGSSVEEVLRISSSFAKAKTLEIKDNRLFVGNVTTDPVSGLTFNARAYRFRKDSSNTYINDSLWDVDYRTFTNQDDIDAINPYNDIDAVTVNSFAYWRGPGIMPLGGQGQYISYTFFTDDISYGDGGSNTGPGEVPKNPNEYEEDTGLGIFSPHSSGDYTSKSTQTWKNYKSPFHLAYMKGYQRGEVYRFGIVLFDLKGRPGLVNWIGDIKFPQTFDFDDFESDYRFNTAETNPSTSDTYKILGIKFNVEIPSEISDNVSGFQIVRLPRRGKDKTVLGTGALFQTYDYNTPNGFSENSDPFLEGNSTSFFAKGPLPDNMVTTIDSIPNIEVIDASTGTIFSGGRAWSGTNPSMTISTELGAFECPDFHFLGDPSFKEGDKLRLIGKTFSNSPGAKRAIMGGGNWEVFNNVPSTSWTSDALDGLDATIGGMSSNNYVRINSAAKNAIFGGIFTPPATYELWTNNDIPKAANAGSLGNGRLTKAFLRYYPLYAIENFYGRSLSARDYDIDSSTSIGTGEVGKIGGKEFKNQFIGFALTHDGDYIVEAADAEDITKFSTYLKNQVVGVGNKCLAVKLDKALDWQGATGFNIPKDNYVIQTHLYWGAITDPVGVVWLTSFATDEITTGTDETQVPIFQYVRDLGNNQYGGNTASDRIGQIYIPCSAFVATANIQFGRKLNDFKVLGGDTMVVNYPITRSARRTDGKGYRVGVSFPCETTVATELRSGDNYMTADNSGLTDPYLPDDYDFNSVYTFAADEGIETYISPLTTAEEVTEYDNRIFASNLKTNGELVDSWRFFDVGNYLDVDGVFGKVNSILRFRDEIYYLQDRGFGKLSINPRALIQTGGVGELQLGAGNVLDDFKYISTEYGSNKQFASIVTDRGLYFFDDLQNKLFVFGAQGLIPLSEMAAMNSYFQDPLTDNIALKDNPFMGKGISCVWDKKYNEVLYTLHRESLEEIAVTRSSYTFTITNTADYGKIKLGDVVEYGDTLLIVKEIPTISTVKVFEPVTSPTLPASGNFKIRALETVSDEVGDANGVFTNVDRRLSSTCKKGDWIRYYKTIAGVETGPFYVQVSADPDVSGDGDSRIYHYGGTFTGDVRIEGFIKVDNTIAFNEQLNAFTTFYSFAPDIYLSLYNSIWSVNPYNNNQIFLHDSNSDYCIFYGGYYDSTLQILVNMEPRSTKVFDSITFQMEAERNSFYGDDVQVEEGIDEIRFHTDYQNTDWIVLDSSSSNRNLRRAEKEWQLQIPRNVVKKPDEAGYDLNRDIFDPTNLGTTRRFKDRIRDKYMAIDIKIKNGTSGVKKLLHYVNTFFRFSKR